MNWVWGVGCEEMGEIGETGEIGEIGEIGETEIASALLVSSVMRTDLILKLDGRWGMDLGRRLNDMGWRSPL
jgi:hypothetical protein